MEELLPALGPHGIAKQRPVIPFFDTVTSCILLIRPTDRQIFQLVQGFVYDCAIA
jgi:hypothetical protein